MDLVAPTADWTEVENQFRRWAESSGFDPIISCPHRPGVLVLVAMGDPRSPVYKLEVLGHRYFRGARVYAAEDLLPAMEMDPRGWRRLRPGASALVKLLPNGVTWSGGLKWEKTKAERVIELLRRDPEGVHLASQAFSSMGWLVESAAAAAAAGHWPRVRMIALECWALSRGLVRPAQVLSRARHRASPAGRCGLLRGLRQGGLVHDPAEFRKLAEDHG